MSLDLRFPVFCHGQLYVALSRVTDVARITVLLLEGSDKTTNIVYPEVLDSIAPVAPVEKWDKFGDKLDFRLLEEILKIEDKMADVGLIEKATEVRSKELDSTVIEKKM